MHPPPAYITQYITHLLPELLQFGLRLDLSQIQLLHRVLVLRLLVRHPAHDAGDTGPQLGSVVNAVVHLFDGLAQLRFDGDQHLVLGFVEFHDGLGTPERWLVESWAVVGDEWSGSCCRGWARFVRCIRCGPNCNGALGGCHAAAIVGMVIVVMFGICHLWEIFGASVGTADDRGRIVSGCCWSCQFRFCIGRFFQLWTPRRLLILFGRFAAFGSPVLFLLLFLERFEESHLCFASCLVCMTLPPGQLKATRTGPVVAVVTGDW